MTEEDGYVCKSCDEPLHDITEILGHGCEPVPLKARSLTRRERNTLLYVEARLVDHGGKLDPAQMNYEDDQNLKVFVVAGLLEVSDAIRNPDNPREDIRMVESFTDEAWDLAGDCRQLRAIEDDRVDFPVGSVE